MIVEVTRRGTRDEYGPIPVKDKISNSLYRDEISLLKNNVEYYLHDVFIMVKEYGYQLVVIHAKQVRTNRLYPTLRTAKVAFARMYNRKSWKKGVKPRWSPLYKPQLEWLDDRIKILEDTAEWR